MHKATVCCVKTSLHLGDLLEDLSTQGNSVMTMLSVCAVSGACS